GRKRRELVSRTRQIRHTITAIHRQRRNRLEHNSSARRYQVVDATQGFGVSIVVVVKIEIVEPNTRRYMNGPGKLDLILNVGRRQVCSHVIVRIACSLAESDRSAYGWVGVGR